jgi:hypothetical protein
MNLTETGFQEGGVNRTDSRSYSMLSCGFGGVEPSVSAAGDLVTCLFERNIFQ